jgi:hypothetical protein
VRQRGKVHLSDLLGDTQGTGVLKSEGGCRSVGRTHVPSLSSLVPPRLTKLVDRPLPTVTGR